MDLRRNFSLFSGGANLLTVFYCQAFEFEMQQLTL